VSWRRYHCDVQARRVDAQERALLDARQQRHPLRQRNQMGALNCGELVGVAEGELAQGDP
jgi:hypothetical protein